MKREVAVELMEETLKLTAQLNVIMHKIEASFSDDELRSMRQHAARLLFAIDEHLFRPLTDSYPDLDPHR